MTVSFVSEDKAFIDSKRNSKIQYYSESFGSQKLYFRSTYIFDKTIRNC